MAKKIDVNGLGHYHDKVSAMLASEYSSSKTYAVGDYCFHAGTLYECTTAITTAEEWTAGHWTAAKLADDTSALKTAVTQLDTKTGVNLLLSMIPRIKGFISSQGKWTQTNNNKYLHIAIPVKGGEKYTIQTGSASLYYACVKTYPETLTDNTDVDFSTVTGWTSRKLDGANITLTGVLPNDGRYLILVVLNNNNDSTPSKVVVDDFNLSASSLTNALIDYANAKDANQTKEITQAEVNLFSVNGVNAPIDWELGTVQGTTIGQPVTNYESTTRKRTVGTYKFEVPFDITCNSDYYYNVWLLDNSLKLSSFAFNNFSSFPFTIPANTYFRIAVGKKDDSDMTDTDVALCLSVKFNEFKDIAYTDNSVRWCAMGDSITQGYYSYLDNGTPTSGVDTTNTWVALVSTNNKWQVNNIGVGGTGYLDKGAENTCGYQIARSTDFASYNIVTIAYGINDWKGGQPLGTVNDDATAETATTTLQAMKATIKAILTSNPDCKIIVILPMNCRGYDFSYGDASTNYGLGYTNATNGKTLEEFVQGMIDVCNYYGIQYIDMSHYSPVNRENIVTALLDGVHPSLAIHKLMGYELSKKITF